MFLSQVKGQNALKERLVAMVQAGHVPHAIMLCGKDGYGTLALALALGEYISCEKREDSHLDDSCGECASCRKYSAMVHPDMHFVFPTTTTDRVKSDPESGLFVSEFRKFVLQNNAYVTLTDWYGFIGAGNKQGVINVRDANSIISSLSLKPFESQYRIMLIWHADRMNTDAANKLLKILEEPYPNTVFILTTEHKEKILPTIFSRVQTVDVPKLDRETLVKEIKAANPSMDDTLVAVKAELAEGDITETSEEVTADVQEMRNSFMKINQLAISYRKNAKGISDCVDAMSKMTRNSLKVFFAYFLTTVEKCWLYNNGVSRLIHPLEGMDGKFRDNYPKFITQNNIEQIYSLVEKASFNVDRNCNAKINLTNMILNLGFALEAR